VDGAYFEWWTAMIEDHIYWEGIISFSGTGMMTSTTQHVKVCLEYLPASAFVAVS